MQKVKTFFNELQLLANQFLYRISICMCFIVFTVSSKTWVTNLVTKAKPLSYADLHSHLLTHEFLHKTSLQSMMVTPPLLLTPAQPSSSNVAHNQFSSSYNNNPNFSHGKPR